MKYFIPLTLAISAVLCSTVAQAQTDVLMQHNDLNRTGWNNTETVLNQTNVSPTTFGLIYNYTVDDQIFAQPLLVNNLTVTDPLTHASVQRNVVFVATVNNTVYAFDADDGSKPAYWQRNFTPAGKVVPFLGDIHPISLCGQIYYDFKADGILGQIGKFGLLGTPAIDKSTNTIYFVTRHREPDGPLIDNDAKGTNGHNDDPDWSEAGFYQQLHAIDLSTGADKFNSPVAIDATTTMPGTAKGNVGNIIHFDARRENQRSGLVVSNGIVYIAYAGHCDMNNYHGWVLGYQANNISQQKIKYVTTPNNGRGGIWMCGNAPAVDAAGNLYFATGNGELNDVIDKPGNRTLAIIKAAPNLATGTLTEVAAFQFANPDYDAYTTADLDFGTGLVLIPNQDLVVTAHKQGNLIEMKKSATGGLFGTGSPNYLGTAPLGTNQATSHSSLVYYGGDPQPYLYQFSENTNLKAYPIQGGVLGTPVTSTVLGTVTGLSGNYMSLSSNGNDANSAILWVTHYSADPAGVLQAVKANDINTKLFDSDDNPDDKLGKFAKMNNVIIANGKVYAPTLSNKLRVYGLLTSSNRCAIDVALNKPVTASSDSPGAEAANAVDGDDITRWGAAGGATAADPAWIYVDLGGSYNVCKIDLLWHAQGTYGDYGIDFTVERSNDVSNPTHWDVLNTVTGNTFADGAALTNEFLENTTARFIRIRVTKGLNGFCSINTFNVYGSPGNNCVGPANPAASLITQGSARLTWDGVPGVTSYRVRFQPSGVQSWVERFVSDPGGASASLSIDLNALACSRGYTFDIQSVCGTGIYSTSNTRSLNTLACSNTCNNKTRWANGDLGDVATAGQSCLIAAPTVFQVSGAGTGFTGNADQFQGNFLPASSDGEFIAQLQSQDNVGTGANQAGLMARDSVTDVARFMYVGKTANGNFYMMYRNTVGGPVITTSTAYVAGNDYFRIVKTGTTYAAYYGTSFSGPWTILGTSHDLGFGAGATTYYQAVVVSSLVPGTASTAVFSVFDPSNPLPIKLAYFTASNVNNEYSALKWGTTGEQNNDHFDIERSADGITFAKIGEAKGSGTTDLPVSYTYNDVAPLKGLNYYRLKQVDFDNGYTYSPQQLVKFGRNLSPVILPNPIHGHFRAIAGSEKITEIALYNVEGRALNLMMNDSGTDDMEGNISKLVPGIYFMKVKTASKVYQFKVIKE